MAEKQAPLNGAYYGPAIPPPPQAYHRPSRGGYCLLKFLLQVVIAGVLLAGLAVFLFWIIVRPNKIKFYVTDVSLTEFNLTSGNMLHYNLNANFTVRNPNKRIGVYYDRIEARAYYQGERFDTKALEPFYQGHKNTSYMRAAFEGQNVVVLGDGDREQYNRERDAGLYEIDVKLYLRVRFKVGKLKTGRFKPKVKCELKVPFSTSNGGIAPATETTRCHVDY